MQLTEEEAAWSRGEAGPALAMATRILADTGGILGADRLVKVSSAHIDGCLYHGDSGVAFAEKLVAGGGQVRVPTSLNVGALDLVSPEHIGLPDHERAMAGRLMQAYIDMGCAQTWTCAPYQAGYRPAQGEDIAWAESNAVVFANSVLGARTNRYGDFLDICAAITGRVPRYGLHLPENRLARVLVRTDTISTSLKRRRGFYPILGSWLGRAVGERIAVIDGLPEDLDEDCLKALGAAAASTGSVAMFHVAGVTPEAATVEIATGGEPPVEVIDLTPDDVHRTRQALSTVTSDRIDVVALGSPHYSHAEIDEFERYRNGRSFKTPVYLCTARHVRERLEHDGRLIGMKSAGVRVIVDTCVVVTTILAPSGGNLMTDSGKFAHYSPSTIGYEVIYGSTAECVESAVAGRLVILEADWR